MSKMEDLYPLILECIEQGKDFYFPIKGKSMQPLLHTNDVVGIRKIESVKVGDIVLFRRDNGAFVLHRVRKVNKDGTYNFVGDYQTYIEKNVRFDQLIAVVFSYRKKGKEKEYFLKSLKYKIYKLLVKSKLVRKVFSKF